MSPSDLAALGRRHLLALTLIVLLAVGIAYSLKRTPPTYQESATAILTVPNQYAIASSSSLITTGELVVTWINGAQGQQQLIRAGPDDYAVALINFNNLEYPYYGEPYLTISATGQDPAAAHRTFIMVIDAISAELRSEQVQQGVTPRNRVIINLAGDSGPLIQLGSRKRTFAGLTVLTLVGAYLVLAFLDRHPVRLSHLLRSLTGRRWRFRPPPSGRYLGRGT